MSYNGSGVFVINTAGQPVVNGTIIDDATFNLLTADLANGLTNALTKDGQSTPTANIKLGGFKLTGLGDATTAGDGLAIDALVRVLIVRHLARKEGTAPILLTAGALNTIVVVNNLEALKQWPMQ